MTLCACGCGAETGIAKYNDPRSGVRKGDNWKYLRGHSSKARVYALEDGAAWDVRDTGYTSPCWVWKRGLRPNGYAAYLADGEQFAHRVMYRRHGRDIPDGYHVDHLCMVKACVNPDHLEAVTPLVNAQRYWASRMATA